MRILVISDIVRWKGFEEIFDKIKPDVVILPGDLTSDGFAAFWSETVQQIPKFQSEKATLMKKMGIIINEYGIANCSKKHNLEEWIVAIDSLEDKYKHSQDFLDMRKKIHVDKFYDFLRYAGKKSKVLVIRGDHDEDFKDDYIVEKINKIPGCKEISGKLVEIDGLSFLGLGYNDTYYLTVFKPIIEKFKDRIDIVATHCKQNRVPMLSQLNPKLIIRGHHGSGHYLINNIPAIFTQGVKYTVIEMNKKGMPKIVQYVLDSNDKLVVLKEGTCKPWGSDPAISQFDIYDWLKPYPEVSSHV